MGIFRKLCIYSNPPVLGILPGLITFVRFKGLYMVSSRHLELSFSGLLCLSHVLVLFMISVIHYYLHLCRVLILLTCSCMWMIVFSSDPLPHYWPVSCPSLVLSFPWPILAIFIISWAFRLLDPRMVCSYLNRSMLVRYFSVRLCLIANLLKHMLISLLSLIAHALQLQTTLYIVALTMYYSISHSLDQIFHMLSNVYVYKCMTLDNNTLQL